MTPSARLVGVEDLADVVDDAVVLKPLGVRVIGRALRNARYLARRNGAELSPVLDALLGTIETAERQLPAPGARSTAVSLVDGGGFPDTPSDRPEHGPVLSSVDVARLAGITRQAVDKAARRGRLAGRLDRGRWTFTERATQQWLDSRTQ